jgi:NADH oxidase (H2O2-forming)
MNIIIIGAGTSARLFAQELRKKDKESKITLIEKSIENNYSICSLPYYLSGQISLNCLFNEDNLKFNNINLICPALVISIDKKNKKINYIKKNKNESINYDKLIITTGSKPFIPNIKGIDKIDYLTFYSLTDTKKLKKIISKKKLNITIIGAGYIGVELSDALIKLGQKVTLIEKSENILAQSIDSDFSKIIENELIKKGVVILTNTKINEVVKGKIILTNNEIKNDLLILCTGSKPNIELAKKSKLKINKGIIVNKYLQTSDSNIYALGDCTEYIDFFNERIVCGLASTAQKMAKLLANNFNGKKKELSVLNASISKVSDLIFGLVGQKESKKNVSSNYKTNLLKKCFNKKNNIFIKIIANNKGIIVGCQLIGITGIAPRINLISLAIKNKIHLKELINMDNCYNPSISPLFEPISIACEVCLKKIKKEYL